MTSASQRLSSDHGPSPDERVRRVTRMLLAQADGVTALDLGRHLGLGRTPIYDRLRGIKPFTVAELVAMADYFGVPPELFLAGPAALLRPAGHSPQAEVITPGKFARKPAGRPALSRIAA